MALENPVIMEYCRLCQCNFGKIPIKCDEQLISKITEVTRVQVNDELKSLLPLTICVTCVDKTLEAYNFIQTVQEVDRNLRKTVNNQLDEFSEHRVFLTPKVGENSDCEDITRCDKCPATFTDRNMLQIHLDSHKITDFHCSLCLEYLETESDFISHKKNHPELGCSMCNQSFNTEVDCKTHTCVTTVQKESDGVKDRPTRTSKKLETDGVKMSKLRIKDFECSLCSKCFSSKKTLRVHLKIHKTYTCTSTNCHKILPSARSLRVHQLEHQEELPYLCVTCGKGFKTKYTLTSHEKIHAAIKGYKCDLCDVSFSARSNLRTHQRVYHEGQRFYCSQCTKEFLTKYSLDRHEKIHAGIKDFKCEQCTSAFYTRKELLNHSRYHLGIKRYKCEECFKTFFEPYHLTIHLRRHRGERPYVCQVPGCGKAFAERPKVKRHHKAVHSSTTE